MTILGRYLIAIRRRFSHVGSGILSQLVPADLSVFHEFAPPPTGGGHQFLRGLMREWRRRGYRVENNRISRTTRACLMNSFNFDADRLAHLRRAGCRMVHRVDGPIGVYRGTDIEVDRRIHEVNRRFADATIFQSSYSLQKHLELGMEFAAPQVIMNASDPELFFPRAEPGLPKEGRIRLIATSWSKNPNKGAADCRVLERMLDWERFELTFVGRSPVQFDKINVVPPLPSAELADLLREHHIYFAPSRFDPCSNALIEALSIGLPAIARNSGGHPEIVGDAGFCYDDPEEVPALLERLVDEYEQRRARISVPHISEVANRYLEVMGIEPQSSGTGARS